MDGTVARVTLNEAGEIITDSRRTYWATVEELFSWISSPNVQDAGATQFLRNPAPLP